MVTKLEWSEDYETGNIMVDREHKALLELVSLIIELDEMEESYKRDEALKKELEAMHRYVAQHFSHEEQLLEAVESPEYPKQRLLHRRLRFELNTFWEPGQDTPSRDVIHQLAKWSQERLFAHFTDEDYHSFNTFPFVDE